jgi:hypothetical protein
MLITPIVRMEILDSARTSVDYIALETELDALRILRNDRAIADAAAGAGHPDPSTIARVECPRHATFILTGSTAGERLPAIRTEPRSGR